MCVQEEGKKFIQQQEWGASIDRAQGVKIMRFSTHTYTHTHTHTRCVCVSVCLSVCLAVPLPPSLSHCLSACLSINPLLQLLQPDPKSPKPVATRGMAVAISCSLKRTRNFFSCLQHLSRQYEIPLIKSFTIHQHKFPSSPMIIATIFAQRTAAEIVIWAWKAHPAVAAPCVIICRTTRFFAVG